MRFRHHFSNFVAHPSLGSPTTARRNVLVIVGAILAVALAGAPTFAQEMGTIEPGTDEAALAISRLDHAAKMDRLNSQGYDHSILVTAGIYYSRKADEAEALSNALRHNRPIGIDDFRHALDTSDAIRYTGGY